MANHRFAVLLSALLVTGAGFFSAQENANDAETNQTACITVEIKGLRNHNGSLRAILFSGPDGFPDQNDKATAKLRVPLGPDVPPILVFSKIPYGTYAIAVLHDEDDNSQMKTGFLGVPLEMFGFSRDAPVFMAPPSFDSAKFEVDQPEVKLTITIHL